MPIKYQTIVYTCSHIVYNIYYSLYREKEPKGIMIVIVHNNSAYIMSISMYMKDFDIMVQEQNYISSI